MDFVWIARSDDAFGAFVLGILRNVHKQRTLLLKGAGTFYDKPAIPLFTSEGNYASRYMRVAPHDLEDFKISRPAWTSGSPLCVALNRSNAEELLEGRSRRKLINLKGGLGRLAASYGQWHPTADAIGAPWNPTWHKGEPPASFTEWQMRVRMYMF